MTKFQRKIYHNRDIKYKISLINHVQYIFDLYGINEQIIRVIPTEYIDRNFSNRRLDFVVECKSGNIYDIECETSSINNQTLDKSWNYLKSLYCRYDNDIYSLIIALSEKNNLIEKRIGTTTHKPIYCEIKKLNGDKYLNNIKKKFNNNEELTSHDCAIIENLPDMKNTKRPALIVEELCNIIKNSKISTANRIKLQSTMWLNIDYYIKDSLKREQLMEMINVEKSQESEFFKWQEEYGKFKEKQGEKNGIKIGEKIGEKNGIKIGEKNGIKIGEKRIIKNLLKTMNPNEIASKTGISLSEINEIAKQ
jgi:predicted XRE-type DNA-binding protein